MPLECNHPPGRLTAALSVPFHRRILEVHSRSTCSTNRFAITYSLNRWHLLKKQLIWSLQPRDPSSSPLVCGGKRSSVSSHLKWHKRTQTATLDGCETACPRSHDSALNLQGLTMNYRGEKWENGNSAQSNSTFWLVLLLLLSLVPTHKLSLTASVHVPGGSFTGSILPCAISAILHTNGCTEPVRPSSTQASCFFFSGTITTNYFSSVQLSVPHFHFRMPLFSRKVCIPFDCLTIPILTPETQWLPGFRQIHRWIHLLAASSPTASFSEYDQRLAGGIGSFGDPQQEQPDQRYQSPV